MKHTVVFFVKPCSSLSSTPKHVQREIRLNEATQKLSHIQQNYHMRSFLLRFTHYIYKPVYANESSKYASQLANSVRPEKKGIAREIKTRGKLISKVVEIIFVCASAWQRIVVRAPPVSKNFDAICRRRR